MAKSKRKGSDRLAVSRFLVLALLAEGPRHGYGLEQLAWNRGFRYWTDFGHSSIYQALKRLEGEGLISSSLAEGGGPIRRVFSLTPEGRAALSRDSLRRLTLPAHPRNELDLGLYALPFLSQEQSRAALDEGLQTLRDRRSFIAERLSWCRERGLRLAALNFDRPLRSLDADIAWLEELREEMSAEGFQPFEPDWERYEYLEPPNPDEA